MFKNIKVFLKYSFLSLLVLCSCSQAKDPKYIVIGVEKFASNRSIAGFIQVLCAKTLEVIKEFEAHKRVVTSFAVSKDGSKIVTGAADGEIKVWSTKRFECTHCFDASSWYKRIMNFSLVDVDASPLTVVSLAIDLDLGLVIALSHDYVKFWSLETGRGYRMRSEWDLLPIRFPAGFQGLDISSHGLLAKVIGAESVSLMSLQDYLKYRKFKEKKRKARSFFSMFDCFTEIEKGPETDVMVGIPCDVLNRKQGFHYVKYSPKGDLLALGGPASIKVFSTSTLECLYTMRYRDRVALFPVPLKSLNFTPCGDYIVFCYTSFDKNRFVHKIVFWHIRNEKKNTKKEYIIETLEKNFLVLNLDGETIITCAGMVRIYDKEFNVGMVRIYDKEFNVIKEYRPEKDCITAAVVVPEEDKYNDEQDRVSDLRDGLGKSEDEQDLEIKFSDGTKISGLSKLFYL